jgi:hypothetical protein
MLKKVVPPNPAAAMLIGRRRKRGRQAHVPAAWEHQVLDLGSPAHHPPQDPNLLMGNGIVPQNLNPQG